MKIECLRRLSFVCETTAWRWKQRAGLHPATLRISVLALVVLATGATQPLISKIEPSGSNQVVIHFDVQPNTTCTVQWTDALNSKPRLVVWSNLWTSPNLPFFEHYVIPDTRTQKQRFYRLLVSP